MKAKAGAQKVKRKASAAATAFKSTAMYDGDAPGKFHIDPMPDFKKGSSMYNKAPGMYGRGSKISYGHNSGMKMSGYAKAGLAGKGLSQNSQQKLSKHMKNK